MLNPTRRAQRGLSIVEMMVGVAIGLFVVAGAAMLLATQLSDNRRLLLETQVQQDLRATADIIVRELRRAGRWGRARDGVWAGGGAPVVNPYSAVEPVAGGGAFADGEEASTVEIAYSSVDLEADEDGAVADAERRGFRLDNGVIQTQLGAGNWQALTDGNTLRVTSFTVRMNRQPVALACAKPCPVGAVACPPQLEVRDMQVDITGQAAHDPSVQRSVRSNVRLRNDTAQRRLPGMNTMRAPRSHPMRAQRGLAALIVVMLLFFIISMVAAYASRNLIFEQKTSANQYRAVQAFEAAEAGIEWATAMLNGGRIDAACLPSDNVANDTFRKRYLILDLDDPLVAAAAAVGRYRAATWVNAGATEPLRPSCVRSAAGWVCSCPTAAAPVLADPGLDGNFPAFRVRFLEVGQPGLVRVISTGCTRLDDACLNGGQGSAGEAASTVSVVLALSSALASPPSAALTVRGALDVGAAAIRLVNTDPNTNGLTAAAGGVITMPAAVLSSAPGSPAELSWLSEDPTLASLDAAHMFTDVFRLSAATYRLQPAARRITDCAAACKDKLADAVQSFPGQVLWVDGDLTIEADVVLGSAAEPVLIVASGNVVFAAADIRIFGLIYSQAADWNNAGSALVQGAAIAEGNFVGNGTPAFQYDADILKRLRLSSGSMVLVPGSWRDF